MAGRAADRGGPRRMGGWSAADERMGRGGWAAADGSRQIADGSARALDASVIAGAGQSSRGGCANPPCEPGSWAGRDGDEDDQGRHGTLSVAPRERRSFAAQLGAGIEAAGWLGLAGWVQLPCQLNLVNFWLPRTSVWMDTEMEGWL